MDSSAKAGQLKLTPSITVSERYDDNIFFAERDFEADYITGIAPEITASYEAKAIEMRTGLAARSDLFSRHTELNNLQYRADLRLNIAQFMKNTSLSVSDAFQFTPEPPAFLVGEEEEELTTRGIRIPRGDSVRNSVSVGLARQISPRNNGRIGYHNTVRRFEDPSLVDSTLHRLQAGLSTQIRRRDTLNTDYEYQLSFPTRTEKIRSHRVGIGLDHRFTQTFSANLGIGGTYVLRDPDDVFSFTGRLSVGRRFKKTHLSLSYSRTIDTTGGLTAEPIISQVISGRIEGNLTKHLTVHLSQNYAANRSSFSDIVDLQSRQTGIALRMQFKPWLRGEANYSYFSQVSEGVVGTDVQRNQIVVILSAHVPS